MKSSLDGRLSSEEQYAKIYESREIYARVESGQCGETGANGPDTAILRFLSKSSDPETGQPQAQHAQRAQVDFSNERRQKAATPIARDSQQNGMQGPAPGFCRRLGREQRLRWCAKSLPEGAGIHIRPGKIAFHLKPLCP